MYIPSAFRFDDIEEQVRFMQRYSFATIVTCIDNIPEATQLPFTVNYVDSKIILSGHFASNNPQAKYIEENISLVIFSEPHAYISPSLYEKDDNVPTWNYIAVHAYGKARIVHDQAEKLQGLEGMINFYEREYLSQWNSLPEKFRTGLVKSIVAFDLEVTDLQAKKKLSQNRSAVERERVMAHLASSEDSQQRRVATYMKELRK